MFRKNYFTILFTIAMLLAGSVAVFAQTTTTSGSVVLDGTNEPVQGATVESFRLDMKGKGPTSKTNKKGEFNFVGLQIGGTYVLVVSAPNIAPTYMPNVKAGAEKISIIASPGDGKKLTEEEVRTALSSAAANTTSGNTNTEMSTDQKKQAEEQMKARAEVEAKNKKIEGENTIIQASMKAGNDAFNAKNYDVAISEYSKGIEANPTYIGSAPGLLNNKGTALSSRGVDTYNQTIKNTDASAKAQGYAKVTKDFADSVESFSMAWTILKNAQPADVTNKQNYDENKQQALLGFRTTVKYMVQTEKVDPSKVATIAAMLTEYLAFETDAAKKGEAEVFLGDIYRINGDSQNAIVEYKKVLGKSPTNADALAGLGLSQANAGYNADGSVNDAMMQEAINNLQKFTEVAPENHKLKVSVKETVDYLKSQNFKPQKTTGGGKKKS